jgi:hypothetical protein
LRGGPAKYAEAENLCGSFGHTFVLDGQPEREHRGAENRGLPIGELRLNAVAAP